MNEVFARGNGGGLWQYTFENGRLYGLNYEPVSREKVELDTWIDWSGAERKAIDKLSIKEYGVPYFKGGVSDGLLG